MKYDYLIVGSGLFGSTFAHEMVKKHKRCLVIDSRDHLGGNIYCKDINGIPCHMYGPHIFHTNSYKIWKYVNDLCEFRPYVYTPLASNKNRLYSLPFNMLLFNKIWGIRTPEAAREYIEKATSKYKDVEPSNLEQQCLKLVGKEIYELIIKHYTEKQWGTAVDKLPSFIIKRLPIRYTYSNNYFEDEFQGIPIRGYNELISNMLYGSDIRLNEWYDPENHNHLAKKVVYTGEMDRYFNYRYGHLQYRSLYFGHKVTNSLNIQGNAVINYCDMSVPYTRTIEHKHFYRDYEKMNSVITIETPSKDGKPFYPINDEVNQTLYNKYRALANKEKNTIFGGRLAEFKYYDMHQVIASALKIAEREGG